MNRMAKREAGKIAAKKKAQKQYRLKQQISRFQTQIIKKAEKAAHAVAAGAVKAARALTQMVAAGLGTDKCPGCGIAFTGEPDCGHGCILDGEYYRKFRY